MQTVAKLSCSAWWIPSALGAIKLSLIPGREGHGIYSNSSCGPVFGSGCDLYITNNANTSSCTSCLGTTYQYPPGKQSSFLTGDHDFFVIDYEVFALQQWQNTSRKGSCGSVIDSILFTSILPALLLRYGSLAATIRWWNAEQLVHKAGREEGGGGTPKVTSRRWSADKRTMIRTIDAEERVLKTSIEMVMNALRRSLLYSLRQDCRK